MNSGMIVPRVNLRFLDFVTKPTGFLRQNFWIIRSKTKIFCLKLHKIIDRHFTYSQQHLSDKAFDVLCASKVKGGY